MVSWPGNRIEKDTVSKSLHWTYPTVKCNRLGNPVLRPLRFVNWIWKQVKSPYSCLPAIFFVFCHGCGWIQNRRLAFIVVTLQERIDRYSAGAYGRKSQYFFSVCLSVIGSKIHESYKSEVKPQIKVVIVQQSAAFRARVIIFTSRASQFRARPFLNRCGRVNQRRNRIETDAVTNETVSVLTVPKSRYVFTSLISNAGP